MTIKEKLYKEYITIYNKVCKLNGTEPLECSEEFFNSARFQDEARTKSKDEWKKEISCQVYGYERAVMRLRLEDYFNTEEGKILKENTEKRLNEIKDARREYIKETGNEIEPIVKSWLGEQWGICLKYNSMEIGIVKEIRYNDNGDKWNDFHLGLDFDIYFDTYLYKEEEDKRFEMNYGCMGSFNLLDTDNLRGQFLLGMGIFATDKERLESLKKRLTAYLNMLNEQREEENRLKEKLANPFKVEKEV